MFRSSTEEVTTGGDTSECGQTWRESPVDRSGINETTSYGPSSASSGSSHQSLDEGSTSSSHGPPLARAASGDLIDSSRSLS